MKKLDRDWSKFRRELHQMAELSGNEAETAAFIQTFLSRCCPPDELLTGLGGHGLAAIYRGEAPGFTIMLRAELDALPIPETCSLEYASKSDGVSHKCGHDGHMAILSSVAASLSERRPACGSVVLLYQPAEETGAGAQRVLADPRFASLAPDFAFALHNLPGFPSGDVVTRPGVFAAASLGFVAEFTGATAHAAEPQHGISPAPAIAQMIEGLGGLAQSHLPLHEAAKVTVTHARVGEEAFGTSPGAGHVMATLRTHTEEAMATLRQQCRRLADGVARTYGLNHSVRWAEPFPNTVNDADCARRAAQAARDLGLRVHEPSAPFPWSEDFGHFTEAYRGALFGLGAGDACPALHHPDYDFPDELIDVGASVFMSLIKQCSANEVSGAIRG